MSRSIFGWSLPPGVSNSDLDPPEFPCDECGLAVDYCQCLTCPECGQSGCLDHKTEFWLRARVEQIDYMMARITQELARRGLPEMGWKEPDFETPPEEDLA